MFDGRKKSASALAALCVTALTGAVLIPSPSSADPSISSVRDRVDQLYHEAEQASERLNDARIRLHDARERLHRLDTDLRRREVQVSTARDEVATSVVAQYEGSALSTTGQVLMADDADEFLGRLTSLAELDAHRGEVVTGLVTAAERLSARRQLAARQAAAIAETKASLADDKATLDAKAAKAKALLGRLEAEERRRLAAQDARESQVSRGSERIPATSAPASGRAATAVSYAMAQVGDAYVWGAAGPSAFDCSGLMMAAWGAAGVGLPHSSAAQMGSGTPVSSTALQPGDLVFYYSPVSHVGMYIGNGMIVHASNPSTGVEVSPVFSMPYSGAVRPG